MRKTLSCAVVMVLMVVFAVMPVQALETEVGETNIMLVGEREHVRTQETNLGNLICDIMVAHTGADLAMTNGGGLRASVGVGPITLEDVLEIHPFGNLVVTLEMTGAQILEALENGVSQFPATDGRFLQVSNIRYSFNPNLPSGERILEVLYKGEPLCMDSTFVVATNGFLAAGGDEYTVMEESELLEEFAPMEEAIIQYLAENSPITPKVEGRISIIYE